MDLTFLEPVYGHPGPVASVHINVSRDAEDADHAVRLRWGKAREDLAAQGADEETLHALDEVVGRTDDASGPLGQIVFAAGGEVLLDLLVSEPPQDHQARFGPLADPMLYLSRRGRHVPYVLAVVDSIGADLSAEYASGRRRTERVEGDEEPTHKPRGGAYHHKQMQRAVDEQVGQNVKRVVDAVRGLAEQSGAEVIAVAGEVQVRGEVIDQLPDGLRGMAVGLEAGSRAAGSEESPLDAELRQRLDERAGEQVRAVANAFEEERGNRERAAEGLAPVVYALQRAQVRTLLWSPDLVGGDTELWTGPSGEQIALTEKELRDIGVQEPVRASADTALVRAAVATSTDLVFVAQRDVRLDEGIGAVLRFSDPSLTG
ncbi:baeRF2 domain-containing protein [Allosalinactinospora lopnorensis]|uniref:baeRF2 domain-containing protein n=1 Tax=Allosalinactinospora lopnorensis TaxID=1352348 RepID=UPI000623BBE8|nr:Vms1/Ankzf1 family peptidyl-tRNA hydrolase [Allosalinactinospora lopnorensis]